MAFQNKLLKEKQKDRNLRVDDEEDVSSYWMTLREGHDN
jgi:hypothetical protein